MTIEYRRDPDYMERFLSLSERIATVGINGDPNEDATLSPSVS